MDYKLIIRDSVNQHAAQYAACAKTIHGYAELSNEEQRSCEALAVLLEEHGFTVERGVGGMPTSFRAVYGSGGLRVGYLCEYDALASLQQDDVPYPQGNGEPGHGCGHNLLGVGSAAAGIALKALIDAGLDATAVVYGTPAEESLAGKTIMAKNGCFRDIDVCLGWHPLDHNNPGEVKFKAASVIDFTFHGQKAHACNCPEKGRSALDAAELMSVGCNYLREHIDRDSYLHYSYINGGERPNIVPDYAKVTYMARAYTYKQMLALADRIENCAKGACMMTDTSYTRENLGTNHDNVLSFSLAKLAHDCMVEVGPPRFSDKDKAYAKRIADALQMEDVTGLLDESILPADGTIKKDNGSSDIADVSQLVPTVNINTACYARHTPNHSWAVTVQADKPAAYKGMYFASEVLALMAARLVTEPDLMEAVRREFDAAEKDDKFD